MTTTTTPDRFSTLPDEPTLAATVTALEEHGFSVEVVDDLDAARQAVLARIPDGSSVMTNTSVTLAETGIADAINDGGPYDSARNKMFALDFATQAQEMKAIGGQPDYALGSVHAVTRDGTLVIASASGSQLASYAWGAANVIFVVGAQKLVPTLEAAHERIYQHSLVLEDARAIAAYGQHSSVVGSPEAVAQKIATNLRALGATRFDLKYGMPGLTHDQLMTNIELYGRQVIPRVRELLS
jgi:alkanesulfonate monooxygenase SsuD/methylene tetrahydromethanopterin reductase-like flavin-dependent oxidoreductase (luciferase family)